MKIAILTRGGTTFGLGNLVRTMYLAKKLKNYPSIFQPVFYTDTPIILPAIKKTGMTAFTVDNIESELSLEKIQRNNCNVIIIDFPNFSSEIINNLKDKKKK